jgi:hypothetical protein
MHDDKNAIEDEDFEDIDFEDIDTDDDFDDETWDDFDEGDGDSDVAAHADDDEKASRADVAAAPKKKTFLQKNFTLIVIGVAVLGGGGFIFSKLGSGPTAPLPDGQTAQTALGHSPDDALPTLTDADADGTFPPMPAPIESAGDDQVAMGIDEIESLDADLAALQGDVAEPEENDVLTPLPEFSAEGEDNMLADLDLPLETPDLPVAETPQDLTENNALSGLQADIAETEIRMEDELPVEDMVPAIEDDETAHRQDATNNTIAELRSTLSDNEAALRKAGEREKKLSADLSLANGEIEALNAEISNLRNEIAALKKGAVSSVSHNASTAQDAKAGAAKISPASSTQNSASKIEKQPASLEEKSEATEWVMRSARPGEASIASKGSLDFRRVEVGDHVAGLGRIESIAIENGLWVVRGSEGSVSQ